MTERLGDLLQQRRRDDAFRLLYESLHAEVSRYLSLRLGRDAADVAQEVWAAASQSLDSLNDPDRPLPWLLGIARHKLIDRQRGHHSFDALSSHFSSAAEVPVLWGASNRTPSAELARAQRMEALKHALATLSPDDLEVLELRFVMGLKPAEMARVLDEASPNAMSQRVVRAVKRLRDEVLRRERAL